MPIGDLAPELSVLLTAVAVLLAAMALPQRLHGWCAVVAIAGLAVAAGFTVAQWDATRMTFSGTFALDRATGWARLLILAMTAGVAALSPAWFATDRRHGEYYAVLLFSALGALAMAGAADLMQLVMGVLLSSVPGYVLAAYHRDWVISLEAGMKYFLVGALANALLVTGVILVMGMAGSSDYAVLAGQVPGDPLTATGAALILVGLLFKLGAVPAHAWMPDVAEGAPVPSAAFLTIVPKIAAAVALFRIVSLVPEETFPLRLLVAIAAAATMTLGNLAALWQTDLRRLLGWSSVSQSGYALMAVAVAGAAETALQALVAFVGVYALANLLAFAVIAHLRGRTALEDVAGLLRARPVAAIALTLALLSFVGIPPLPGFLGKFALFEATLDGGLSWLAVLAVANTVVSLFYYLRVIGPAALSRPKDAMGTLGRASFTVILVALLAMAVSVPVWGGLWNGLPATLLPM
jgi:NADH-quinone oxidoreductase subunit N